MSGKHNYPHWIMLILEQLPPIKEKKNPVIAGLLGFFFGGLGLGLYFQTWQDFVFPVVVFVLLTLFLAPTIILGPFFGLVFAAIWGVVRAADSG